MSRRRIRLLRIAPLLAAFMVAMLARPLRAAPSGSPLSLAGALRQAQRGNLALQRFHELHLAAQARTRRAEGAMRLHVVAEAVGKDGPSSAPGFGFAGLANTTLTHRVGADVVLTQLLYDAGQSRHRILSSRHASEALAADEQAERARVSLDVVKAYADAIQARRRLDVLERVRDARATALRLVQRRLEAGFASRVDVDVAKIGLADTRQAFAEGRSAYLQAVADLNAAMGVPVETSWQLEDVPPDAIPLDANPSQAVPQRAELRALRSLYAAAEEIARSARAARGPTLRGLASGGWVNTAPANAGANHTYAIGVGLTVPLYTGGALEADVDEAEHQKAALQRELAAAEQQVALDVARARLTLDALLSSRDAVEDRLRLARDFAALVLKRYGAGLTGILEVQQAQASLLEAETAAIRLDYRLTAARAELRWALGVSIP